MVDNQRRELDSELWIMDAFFSTVSPLYKARESLFDMDLDVTTQSLGVCL